MEDSMRGTILAAAALAVSVAAPAQADLTLVQIVSGKGLGISGNTPTTTYIKGTKMRTDTVSGNTTQTMIFDVDAQKIYSFDNRRKEADVWDMADFGKQMESNVDVSQMTASVQPNGQTKEVGGHSAVGYDMNVSVPMTMGDARSGMKMMVNLTGPVWVVKGAPGTEDYLQFYKAALDKGFIFGDPRAAKGAAGQMKAMAEMYRQLAETGGVPYETEMTVRMGGDGPMAAMMAKMGGISTTSLVQSSDTSPIADELFAPPAGYKLNNRK
jgi:hypothetical protein